MERAAPTGVVGICKLEAGLAGAAAAVAAAAPAAASSAAHKTRPSTKLSKIRGAGATSKQFRKAGASAGVFAGTEAAASTQASVGGSAGVTAKVGSQGAAGAVSPAPSTDVPELSIINLSTQYKTKWGGNQRDHILGRGTYSIVSLAMRRSDGRLVARKRFRNFEDVNTQTTIQNEIQKMAKLAKLGEGPGANMLRCLAMVMNGNRVDSILVEYADEDLSGRFRRQRGIMDGGLIARLWAHAVNGVAHMHSCFILHRDLKMENMLLQITDGGRLKLLLSDLGFCCDTEGPAGARHTLCIAQAYRPPEVLHSFFDAAFGRRLKGYATSLFAIS